MNINCGVCGDRKIDFCEACSDLEEIAPCLEQTGITDKQCESLQDDTGLNPDLDPLHNNCQDLNDLLDCFLGKSQAELPSYDDCDWKGYMNTLLPRLHTLYKALICSDCGQWLRIHDLEQQRWEVNARYVIEYSTPGMSVTIDRSTGNFTFRWTDWLDGSFTTRLGRGTVTGKINFGMGVEKGLNVKWQIRDVLVSTVSYESDSVSDVNTFRINVYVKKSGEQTVYQRTHNSMSSFTDTVNRTVAVGMNGVLAPGADTGWIQFLEVFNEIVGGSLNDRANVQVQFVNGNKSTVPPYI